MIKNAQFEFCLGKIFMKMIINHFQLNFVTEILNTELISDHIYFPI